MTAAADSALSVPTSGVADPVRRLSAEILAEAHPGTTARWWRSRWDELVAAGVVARRGRWRYGRLGRVSQWLAGEIDDRRPRRAGSRS